MRSSGKNFADAGWNAPKCFLGRVPQRRLWQFTTDWLVDDSSSSLPNGDSSLRLLILTPQLPFPPHKGTTIRNFHLIKNLSTRHEITLLSFHDESPELDWSALRRCCAACALVPTPTRPLRSRMVDLPFPARPDLVRRLRSAAFVANLASLMASSSFDLVQIEGLELAWHWNALRSAVRNGQVRAPQSLPKVVLDDHNAEYVLQRRAHEIDRGNPTRWLGALYSLLQWQKLVRYERRFCQSVSGVIAASEFDRQAILALDSRLQVGVIPNGVDTDHYTVVQTSKNAGCPRVIFTGSMDFRPNVDGVEWLCQQIWPLVVAQVPEATLWIVGRSPKPTVNKFSDDKHVFVTGAVPDVRPYLYESALSVVPLRIGGGSRLKVLEAMAAGVPVVSTTLGCEGIAVNPSTAVIANQPSDFARAIVDLLRDERRRSALALAARSFVEQSCDWRAIVPRLDAFYREVMRR